MNEKIALGFATNTLIEIKVKAKLNPSDKNSFGFADLRNFQGEGEILFNAVNLFKVIDVR